MNVDIQTEMNPEDHIRLVKYIIKSFPSPNDIERDDWFQDGCVGLVKACKSFDSSKGCTFATYACRCILNELKMAYRTTRNIRNTSQRKGTYISLETPIPDSSGECDILLIDTIKAVNNVEDIVIAKELLKTLLSESNWNSRNKHIPDTIILYLQGYKSTDISKKSKINMGSMSRRIKKIRKKTMDYYNETK